MSEMKLHEAIRLGAMLGPQLTDGRTFDGNGGSCAHGSALLAISVTSGCYACTADYWNVWVDVAHPVTGATLPLLSIIRELNDEHGWSRERIADFVETIERRADAERQPPPETVATAVAPVRSMIEK